MVVNIGVCLLHILVLCIEEIVIFTVILKCENRQALLEAGRGPEFMLFLI